MHKIPFNRPSLVGNEVKNIRDAIARGHLAGDGYYTKKCNDHIVQVTGAKAALLTHSCTAALEMAAILCDLDVDDEVIMPSFTFVSTANAVALRRAIPVFVDIRPDTLNIDPIEVEKAVTHKTRAIFAVHYAGVPADMDALAEIAQKHNLILVEDAAQALGSVYNGRAAGSLGDIGAFSFHETKNIISGEGGALTLNRPDLIERAEIIREKGTNRSRFLRGMTDKYTWVDIGSSFLPSELTASFLYAQIEAADEVNTRRKNNFYVYMRAFSELAEMGRVGLPFIPETCAGNGHMFYLLMKDLEDRDAFIAHMANAGIISPFHYVPLHSSPAGQELARSCGELNITDDIAARLVRLPMFYDLGNDCQQVIDIAQTYFRT